MKTRKIISILSQISFCLYFNYQWFFMDGVYIDRQNFSLYLITLLTFFNAGSFFCLYITISSKELSGEKLNALTDFHVFIWMVTLLIVVSHHLLKNSEDILQFYLIQLFVLFITVVLAKNAYISYNRYVRTLNNSKETNLSTL